MKYSKELKIGVFTVIILVVSFFMINYLRGKDIFNKECELKARYEKIDGLVASAPVYIKGYKAGKVTEVSYDRNSGDFVVTCSVSRDFSIPNDSRMVIYGVDIMGTKGIRLDLGLSSEMVEDGGFLASAIEAGMLDGLAADIAPLMKKVTETIDSLNVTVSAVNGILSDENTSNIGQTLAHLEKITSEAAKIASAIGGRSAELDAFILNLSQLSEKLGAVADQADSVMTNISSATSQLTEADIAGILKSVNELLENINDPEGTVGRLFNDDSVYQSLDSLLVDIDALVRKIQENPKKYIKISVF